MKTSIKVKFNEFTRSITIFYHISDEAEDEMIIGKILHKAIHDKLAFTIYEDDFNHRSLILSGKNGEKVKEAYKIILETLKELKLN